MSWHKFPKDDAWKLVTLASIEALGHRVWIRCNVCAHERTEDPAEFARIAGIAMETPLLSIAYRLRCQKCGERKAHCWPEPYSSTSRTSSPGL